MCQNTKMCFDNCCEHGKKIYPAAVTTGVFCVNTSPSDGEFTVAQFSKMCHTQYFYLRGGGG